MQFGPTADGRFHFQHGFLQRGIMLMRYAVVVFPSVYLSQVSFLWNGKMWDNADTPYDSTGSPVFWCQRSRSTLDGFTVNGGSKCRLGRL